MVFRSCDGAFGLSVVQDGHDFVARTELRRTSHHLSAHHGQRESHPQASHGRSQGQFLLDVAVAFTFLVQGAPGGCRNAFAQELQQLPLAVDEMAGLPALEAGEPEAPDRGEDAGLFPDALRLLGTLEILEPDWEEVLRQAEDVPGTAAPETALERIAVYFAFRYLLKTVNDGDLLSRAQLCVFAVLVVERLSAACGLPEALRRFSREIEHNEDNVEALLDAFRFTFTQEDFLAELAK